MRKALFLLFIIVFAGGYILCEEEKKSLCVFETSEDIKIWDFAAGNPSLSTEGVESGKNSLEIKFDPKGEYHPAYMSWSRVKGDWSGFDALVLDVLNPGKEPMPATLLVADKAWAEKGRSYWNRHNGSTMLPPGKTRWVISTGGLYRGEAGSRNNDIRRNIDINNIVRLDFGFGAKGSTGSVLINNLRLIKINRPSGIWAFDFGPDNQSVMPGWTPVSHSTAYKKETGYGWGKSGGAPWNGADRDTTFGPALLRDFCEAGGYQFRTDVPPGMYTVTVIYENSGYWGGEQAMHSKRKIISEGAELWSESRPAGAAHSLYRFEDVEPVGLDIWDTYMKDELAKQAVFNAEAGTDGLTLKFEADRTWGSKISALVIHRANDKMAKEWVKNQLSEVALEFRRMAVCLDPVQQKFEAQPEWKSRGFIAWPVSLEEEVIPASLPPKTNSTPKELLLKNTAVRGETAALCLALRPFSSSKNSSIGIKFEWLEAKAKLSAEIYRVWYNTSRDFNSIAYKIKPFTLRPCSDVDISIDAAREIIVKIKIPEDAVPGEHKGQLTLSNGKNEPVLIPVLIKVSTVIADRQTDYHMGFFGLMPPSQLPEAKQTDILEQTVALLRDSGMNMLCGGPDWVLKGWKSGEPEIDFKEADDFFRLIRRYGFIGPINGYGGLRFSGLHDGYRQGETGDRALKESGLKTYQETLIRAWKTVDAHARAEGWPLIWYAMCDETRVREAAERELDFMKSMSKVSAAFPKTIRTSGSYSVTFNKRPKKQEDMLYWHQRFFENLDISDLNEHDSSVMAEAKRLGKEVHIYNQGTDRYSFGLYQWGEYQRGVKARTQWHLNVLHGYQFFDLDGREPDTAMICYGKNGIYPTIQFERCREGTQDFYLCNTLNIKIKEAGKKGRNDIAVIEGEKLLQSLYLSEREPEKKPDLDKTKASIIAALEALQAK